MDWKTQESDNFAPSIISMMFALIFLFKSKNTEANLRQFQLSNDCVFGGKGCK